MSINTPRLGRPAGHARFRGFLGSQLRPNQLSISSPRLEQPSPRPRIVCQLSDKGKAVKAEHIRVRSPLGEGSFGQVFEGWLATPAGRERVVLKRVKDKVEGAAEMGQMEHLLNVYASKVARGSVAHFVGYSQVQPDEASRTLTEGLWLLWKYEGGKTLAHYLRRRDCIQRLAEDLQVPEDAVLPTVMQHIFEGLSGLHGAGLVHRDVKPLNIIFAEEHRRFKLIDLGACADLRTGTNYVPDESILDPIYCPPEQYCMPTDSPHLAKQLKPLAIAMSPVLWSRFKPDRFDSYSCGLVLMQLAIPKLRSSAGIKQFNSQFKRARYDLQAWRESERLPSKETALLDANGGVGWDLACALLRPRDIQVDDNGGVVFVNNGGAIRLPIKVALRHKFLQHGRKLQLRAGTSGTTTAPSKSDDGSNFISNAVGFWNAASSRLKDLEAKLTNQEQAVALQTDKVEVLKASLADGTARREDVERQESLLSKMTGRLLNLQGELGTTRKNAQRVMKFLTPREKLSKQARAVALQTGKVQTMRRDYATGKIKKGELDRQENLLAKMTNRLGSLQDELNATAAGAQRVFKLFQPRQRALRGEITAAETQGNAKRLFNAFLRSDRLESSLLTELSSSDDETAQLRDAGSNEGRRKQSGSGPIRRSTPDGNISRGSTSGSNLRKGFSLFSSKASKEASETAQIARSERPSSSSKRKSGANGSADRKPGLRTSGTDSRSLSQSAAGAAVTGIYAGLKLTGLALKVATDMAASLGKDAESAFANNEAQRNAKRKQRVATNAFLELLRECSPPVRPQTKWTDIRRFVAKDSRFEGMDEDQRCAIFAEYTSELARSEQSRLKRGEAAFRDMLMEIGLSRDSTLPGIEEQLRQDSRYDGLPDGLDLERIFGEIMEARELDFDFLDLLRECRDPPLTKDTTWGHARRQVSNDPRFEAITEKQRRTIFRSFVDGLSDAKPVPANEHPVAAVTTTVGDKEKESADAASLKDSLSSLQAIRAEQARLKSEYEKMEAKLREMEQRIKNADAGMPGSTMDLKNLTKDINGKAARNLLSRGSG